MIIWNYGQTTIANLLRIFHVYQKKSILPLVAQNYRDTTLTAASINIFICCGVLLCCSFSGTTLEGRGFPTVHIFYTSTFHVLVAMKPRPKHILYFHPDVYNKHVIRPSGIWKVVKWFNCWPDLVVLKTCCYFTLLHSSQTKDHPSLINHTFCKFPHFDLAQNLEGQKR